MTEIVHIGRTVAGHWVAFDIAWDEDLTGRGRVRWSMFVTSPDGAETLQLGYEVADDTFAGQFVHDSATGQRQAVDENADLGDQEITVRFPARFVGVAVEWPTWRGVITVDGADVAERAAHDEGA